MLHDLAFALLVFLPAGLANMAPVFAAHTPGLRKLEYPLDFHAELRGKRIFGEHKTIRGFILAILFGILTAFVEKYLGFHSGAGSAWLFGGLLGFGAIGGDALKSFFKRQLGIAEGQSWFLFDQLDFIVGGIIATYFYFALSLKIYLYIIVLYFVFHLIISGIGYLIGMKEQAI